MKLRFALLVAALLPFACTSEDPKKTDPADKTAKKVDDNTKKDAGTKTELTSMTFELKRGKP